MAVIREFRSEVDTSSAPEGRFAGLRASEALSQIALAIEPSFVVIDRRPLIGQCFLASLRDARPNLAFKGFPSVAAWQGTASSTSASTILLCLPGGSTPEVERDRIARELAEIQAYALDVRVAVMSDCESPEQIVQVFKLGIKG